MSIESLIDKVEALKKRTSGSDVIDKQMHHNTDACIAVIRQHEASMKPSKSAISDHVNDKDVVGMANEISDNGNAAALAAQDWLFANGHIATISEAHDLVGAIRLHLATREPVSASDNAKTPFGAPICHPFKEGAAAAIMETEHPWCIEHYPNKCTCYNGTD